MKGQKSVPRRQGYQLKFVPVIAGVAPSGEALPATLLFDTKTMKGSHLNVCDRQVILKGTGTGWSSSDNFVEWVHEVFLSKMKLLSNLYHKIVLFFDGAGRHLGVRGLTVCKEASVSIVLFPTHATDVIQPLDRALFRRVKHRYRWLHDAYISKQHWQEPRCVQICVLCTAGLVSNMHW